MNMKEKALQRRNSFLLVLAAFIWGIAFVAQSEGGKFGPYTFNGIRFLLGAAVLCPVLLIMSKKNPDHKAPSPKSRKALITGGIAAVLFSDLQVPCSSWRSFTEQLLEKQDF